MGAEPGRRFLKQPAEKIKAVFVALFHHKFREHENNSLAQYLLLLV